MAPSLQDLTLPSISLLPKISSPGAAEQHLYLLKSSGILEALKNTAIYACSRRISYDKCGELMYPCMAAQHEEDCKIFAKCILNEIVDKCF